MKYLIFGSAWYVDKWWEDHHKDFSNQEICTVAINNASRVVTKYSRLHRWYTGTDFFNLRYLNKKPADLPDIHDYINNYKFSYPSIITGDFLFSPYGYKNKCRGTMIVNVCYDLLNKSIARNHICTVGIIGSDLVYDKEKPHFYGRGGNDPINIGLPILEEELLCVKKAYEETGNQIVNLSEESRTRLPFHKVSVEDFIRL